MSSIEETCSVGLGKCKMQKAKAKEKANAKIKGKSKSLAVVIKEQIENFKEFIIVNKPSIEQIKSRLPTVVAGCGVGKTRIRYIERKFFLKKQAFYLNEMRSRPHDVGKNKVLKMSTS